MVNETIKTSGDVEVIIEYRNGSKEIIRFPNTILRLGREALAKSLANDIGDGFNFYISRMLFGDNGTTSGSPKFVDTARNGLFGVTRANKPVISSVDTNVQGRVVFTSVLAFEEANGFTLSEMAIQMNTSDLYSMVTFGGITKTSEMQITWNWSLNFV